MVGLLRQVVKCREEGCVWFFVIDEVAGCINMSCGDDEGVGKGESVEEDLALEFEGKAGEFVEG